MALDSLSLAQSHEWGTRIEFYLFGYVTFGAGRVHVGYLETRFIVGLYRTQCDGDGCVWLVGYWREATTL